MNLHHPLFAGHDSSRPDSGRFERENADFFARVRQAYLKRAHAEPGRIMIIDATKTVGQIQEEIGARIESLCKR